MEEESLRRGELHRTALYSECSECGGRMVITTTGSAGELQLRCQSDPGHHGYRRLRTLTQLHDEGYVIPYVSEAIERKRRRKMEQALEERGTAPEESRALVQYGERFPITLEAATRIIDLFYPNAQMPAKLEAAVLAAQYNLNPLPSRREIYIVKYGEGTDKERDVVVTGIPAHRILARRKAIWTYVEVPGCPTSPFRPMNQEEVESMGEEYAGRIWATVTIETSDGKRYTGIGNYQKTAKLIGEDKGNTRWHMASKRAEGDALSRIIPAEEMPAPADYIEGVYVDVTDVDLPGYQQRAAPKQDAPARGARPIQPNPSRPAASTSTTPERPPLTPEQEKLWSMLGDAGFLTPSGRLRADRAEELRKLLSKHGAEKLSDLKDNHLLEFGNALLDLAIARVDAEGDKETKQSQLPVTG